MQHFGVKYSGDLLPFLRANRDGTPDVVARQWVAGSSRRAARVLRSVKLLHNVRARRFGSAVPPDHLFPHSEIRRRLCRLKPHRAKKN